MLRNMPTTPILIQRIKSCDVCDLSYFKSVIWGEKGRKMDKKVKKKVDRSLETKRQDVRIDGQSDI